MGESLVDGRDPVTRGKEEITSKLNNVKNVKKNVKHISWLRLRDCEVKRNGMIGVIEDFDCFA